MIADEPRPGGSAISKQRHTSIGSLPETFTLALEAVAFVKALRKKLVIEFEMAGLALTPGEARVLIFLGHNEGLRQSQLAHMVSCDPMTLVGILDRLEAGGLVIRARDEADRRAKCVHLEPQGKALVRRVEAIVNALCERSELGLDEQQIEMMRVGLSHMAGNLDSPRTLTKTSNAC
jgi:MarR family transcriptional regulator, transcriptional regulator for hemolysin